MPFASPCLSLVAFAFFFFSSRRRHTRWPRDWSSDVCSSDLDARPAVILKYKGVQKAILRIFHLLFGDRFILKATNLFKDRFNGLGSGLTLGHYSGIEDSRRSEERRVGKECSAGGGWEQ